MLAFSIIIILSSGIFMLRSNLPDRQITSTWELISSKENTRQISANLTTGDRVKLIVTPMPDWGNLMEPTFEGSDVPFDAKFAWVNITDPHGEVSAYEIILVRGGPGGLLRVYRIDRRTLDGFSRQAGNETIQNEKAIVGDAFYDGLYVAEIVALVPGGGTPGAISLFKEKQTTVITYPYRDYFNYALIVFVLGIVLFAWSIMRSRRREQRRMQARNR